MKDLSYNTNGARSDMNRGFTVVIVMIDLTTSHSRPAFE
jgi:hypothetical protein